MWGKDKEGKRKIGKMTKVRGKKEKINFWLILLLYYYYVTSYKIILLQNHIINYRRIIKFICTES